MSDVVSVIVPAYNEATRVAATLDVLLAAPRTYTLDIVVVDDGSTDTTPTVLKSYADRCVIVTHEKNRGKGAAIRTGIAQSRGVVIAIHDADAEYSFSDLVMLITEVMSGRAEVVYGSRMIGKNPIGYWRYYFGNLVISACARMLYRVRLTDVETGAKVFRRRAYESLSLTQDRFGFEIELTTQLLRAGYHISELPMSYSPRGFAEGKKISWRDGVQALWLLVIGRW